MSSGVNRRAGAARHCICGAQRTKGRQYGSRQRKSAAVLARAKDRFRRCDAVASEVASLWGERTRHHSESAARR
ncbi:hypothetical protein OFN94_34540, partial [Escherichia coli]|nr:hypothetical protein [Escherichia coli]